MNTSSTTTRRIGIRVCDAERLVLENADVQLVSDARTTIALYDANDGLYHADIPSTEPCRIHVAADGHEPQTRPLDADDGADFVEFYLGRPGYSYTYIDGIKIPYISSPDEIGVIARRLTAETLDRVNALLDDDLPRMHSAKLAQGKASDGDAGQARVTGHATIRKRSGAHRGAKSLNVDHVNDPHLRALRTSGLVSAAGPYCRIAGAGIAVFINSAYIVVRDGLSRTEAEQIIAQAGFISCEPVHGHYNAYLVTTDPGVGEGINQYLSQLHEHPAIRSVSANFGRVLEPRTIPPDDKLWPLMWDRQAVNCVEAWRILDDPAIGKTFGDPRSVIAIIDDGIESLGGIPRNADFQGTVKEGRSSTLNTSINTAANPERASLTIFDYSPGATAFAIGDVVTIGEAEDGTRVIRAILLSPLGGNARIIKIDPIYDPIPAGTDFVVTGKGATRIVSDVPASEAVLDIADAAARFHVGQTLSIGVQGAADTEEVTIKAVALNAVTTTPVFKEHLAGTVVEADRKVYKLYDFDTTGAGIGLVVTGPDNDHPYLDPSSDTLSSHGVACAGIAAGRAENLRVAGTLPGVGVVGVAPDVRLIGVIHGLSDPESSHAFRWAAGVAKPNGTYPGAPRTGADIISYSYSLGFATASQSSAIDSMFTHIVRRGRGGRGTMIFIAAGNESTEIDAADGVVKPWCFAVGATWHEYDPGASRFHETKASYSVWSRTTAPFRNIDFCGVGGALTFYDNYPPRVKYVVSAALKGTGNISASRTPTTTMHTANPARRIEADTMHSAAAGTDVLEVTNARLFTAGEVVRIGQIEDANIEWGTVLTIVDDTHLKLAAPLAFDHIYGNEDSDLVDSIRAVIGATRDTFEVNYLFENWDTYKVGDYVRITPVGGLKWVDVTAVVQGASNGAGSHYARITVTPPFAAGGVPVAGDPVLRPQKANIGTNVVGTDIIEVASTAGFVPNEWITIGDPASDHFQAAYVHSILPPTGPGALPRLKISGLLETYAPGPAGINIYRGDNDYFNRMNGTSAACPNTAGVGALVLAVKPALSWVEVRDILQRSARRVDLTVSTTDIFAGYVPPLDPRWRDIDGKEILVSSGVFTAYSAASTAAAGTAQGATSVAVAAADIASFRRGNYVELNLTGGGTTYRTIIGVDPATATVYLDSPLHQAVAGPAPATTGRTTIGVGGASGSSINVVNNQSFHYGQAVRIADPAGNIDAVVTSFPAPNRLGISRSLPHAVAAGVVVTGGRVALTLALFSGTATVDGVATVIGALEVKVNTIGIFNKGCAVVFVDAAAGNRERRTIKEVKTATRTIVLSNGLNSPYPAGTTVITTGRTTVGPAGAAVGATSIPVADSEPFVVGQAIRVMKGAVEVLGVIREIPDTTHLVIDTPLETALAAADVVEGGRIPHQSLYYGRGRVDAEAAVKAAVAYSHDQRDLTIRSYDTDAGTAELDRTQHAMASPDIWIRNVAPSTDGARALPVGYKADVGGKPMDGQDAAYNAAVPHQNPARDKDRYVYARIKNRGSLYDGLDAWARVFVYRSRSNAPFRVRDIWDDTVLQSALTPASNKAGTYLIAERPLFNAGNDSNIRKINGTGKGGIQPGRHFIVRAKWDKARLPTAGITDVNMRLRTHLLVEVTPHDGALVGQEVGKNNNLAMREISFAKVEFRKNAAAFLSNKITVARTAAAPVTTPYRIVVADGIGYFQTRGVEIVATRTTVAGVATVRLRFDGANWTKDDATQTWITFPAKPKQASTNTDINDADSDQYGIYFEGTFDVDQSTTLLELKVQLFSHADAGHVRALLLEEILPIKVKSPGRAYGDLNLQGTRGSSLHGFADMTKLAPQTEDLAFGPKSSDLFRLTSSFMVHQDGAGTQQDAKAFAATTGTLMVQRVWDNDLNAFDTGTVNVILRPMERTAIGFSPVRYFVYRGLRVEDFLKGTDAVDEKFVAAASGAPTEFIAKLQQQHADRIAVYNAVDPTNAKGGRPAADIPSDEIGWIPEALSGLDVERFFRSGIRLDGTLIKQLPMVKRGDWIGNFAAGATAGFEIVMDDGPFAADLAWARAADFQIDLTDSELEPFDLKLQRETICSFVDPAAYYGMHTDIGAYVPQPDGTELKTGDDLYAAVLEKFATRNTVYIDIRNEHNYSLDFYGNYSNGTGALKFGAEFGRLAEVAYDTDSWPIIVYTRDPDELTELPEGAPAPDEEPLYVALPVNENANGVLYFQHAEPIGLPETSRFVGATELREPESGWTRPIGLNVPQTEVQPGDVRNVAGVVRLMYGRGVDAAKQWGSESAVPKFETYVDNVFGPIDAEIDWNTSGTTKAVWSRVGGLRYIDGTSQAPQLAFGAAVERGIAVQSQQTLFYNAAVDFKSLNAATTGLPTPTNGAAGGFSPSADFFNASGLFNAFEIVTTSITDAPTVGVQNNVKLLQLSPKAEGARPESVMLLGLTNTQHQTLKTASSSLSDKHPVNIVLKRQEPTSPATYFESSGRQYQRYTVELRGLHADTFVSVDAQPANPIYAYTTDGLAFVTAGFDFAQMVPPTYNGTHEENRAQGDTDVDAMIQVDTAINAQMGTFISQVAGITDTTPNAKTLLTQLVQPAADAILNAARTYADQHAPGDDRPLYWARLRMAHALKSNKYLMKDLATRDELAKVLEERSRGYTRVDFSSVTAPTKKILISGFDPFGLDDKFSKNPSDTVALSLHGKSIGGLHTGKMALIQSVVLPVRFKDFDDELIEHLFEQYLSTNHVDMIMTISQNGNHTEFDIERFASRFRNPNRKDNDDQYGIREVGSDTSWRQFYQTTLPVLTMMADVSLTGGSGQETYFDQSYESEEPGATPIPHSEPHPKTNQAHNLKTPISGLEDASIVGVAVNGSGGDYLSNEIFYRVARLRDALPALQSGSRVKTGHLHIPSPKYSSLSMQEILDKTRDLLRGALDGL